MHAQHPQLEIQYIHIAQVYQLVSRHFRAPDVELVTCFPCIKSPNSHHRMSSQGRATHAFHPL